MIVVNYPSSVLETLPREFLSFMYKVTKPKPKLYRQPDQGETIEKSFLLQLQETSCLQSLKLMRDFNHMDVFWESNTAASKQSRRLLACVSDNFLVQV